MLASAPGIILTLAFPKQSKFLVTSYAAAQRYRICILSVLWNTAACFVGYLFDLWIEGEFQGHLELCVDRDCLKKSTTKPNKQMPSTQLKG